MRAFVVVSLLTVAACGGSPTQPDPTPVPPTTPVTAPEPAPQPAEPVPAPPVPPTPVPEPVWTATTTSAHWYGPELLPATFIAEWRYDTLWFGALVADIHVQDDRSIFATGKDYTIQIVIDGNTATWTLNGLAGQASGTITRQ